MCFSYHFDFQVLGVCVQILLRLVLYSAKIKIKLKVACEHHFAVPALSINNKLSRRVHKPGRKLLPKDSESCGFLLMQKNGNRYNSKKLYGSLLSINCMVLVRPPTFDNARATHQPVAAIAERYCGHQ